MSACALVIAREAVGVLENAAREALNVSPWMGG